MAEKKSHTHKFVVCSNIFIRKGGKYLMIRRSADRKWMPNHVHTVGGKMNLDENPYDCALRELKEEAGITAKNIQLEVAYHEIAPYKKESCNWLVFYFSGEYKSGRVKNKISEGELVWLTPRELLKSKLHSSIKFVIKHVLSKKTGPVFGTLYYDDKNTVIKKKSKLNICEK
ncbi:MAG: NUDIX domain-containing protein [Parcubacteria group bacterium]